jgi:hypothetical protein
LAGIFAQLHDIEEVLKVEGTAAEGTVEIWLVVVAW